MAPPVAHRPEGSCVNFPLCKKAQCKRKGDDGRQCRQPHCDTCSNRPVCSAPHCAQHVAPDGRNWKANGFCVEHIRAEEFEQYRDWSICQNSIAGCRRLCLKRGGGKCFACQAGNVPCVNAPQGCPKHVFKVQGSKALRACVGHGGVPCSFAPKENVGGGHTSSSQAASQEGT
jgi:hypothetical protein